MEKSLLARRVFCGLKHTSQATAHAGKPLLHSSGKERGMFPHGQPGSFRARGNNNSASGSFVCLAFSNPWAVLLRTRHSPQLQRQCTVAPTETVEPCSFVSGRVLAGEQLSEEEQIRGLRLSRALSGRTGRVTTGNRPLINQFPVNPTVAFQNARP